MDGQMGDKSQTLPNGGCTRTEQGVGALSPSRYGAIRRGHFSGHGSGQLHLWLRFIWAADKCHAEETLAIALYILVLAHPSTACWCDKLGALLQLH